MCPELRNGTHTHTHTYTHEMADRGNAQRSKCICDEAAFGDMREFHFVLFAHKYFSPAFCVCATPFCAAIEPMKCERIFCACVCVCVRASSLCISNSRKFPKANPKKLLQVKIKCDRIRVKVRAVCKCFLISYPPFPPQLPSCLWFQASTSTNILFSLHLLLLLHLVWLNWCQWFVRVFLTLFGRLTRPCNYSRGRQPHQQREA